MPNRRPAAYRERHPPRTAAALAAKVHDLIGGRGARGVARQPEVVGLKELLWPNVMRALAEAPAPAKLGDRVLTSQPAEHYPHLLFGRELSTVNTLNVLHHPLARSRLGA